MRLNRKILVLFLISVFFSTMFSQEVGGFEQPDYLKSVGPVPHEMLQTFEEKVQGQVIKSSIYRSRDVRLAEINFYENANFWVTDLLQSGKLLFGDQISSYVNKVCDQLLKDEPEIRSLISVYVVKSSSVNAFATDQGVIVVNLGLLANLENEAQLAMVLAHEIAHFLEKHSLEGFEKGYEVAKEVERNQKSLYESVIQKHLYSQNLELEADQIGLNLFLKTNYKVLSAVNLFDLLSRADTLGFESLVNLKSTSFDFSVQSFNYDTIIKKSVPSDSLWATHPEPLIRKAKLEKFLASMNVDYSDGQAYLVSKEEFDQIKMRSKMEIPRLLLLEGRNIESIYKSIEMMNNTSYSAFFEVMIGKAFVRELVMTKNKRGGRLEHRINSSIGELEEYFEINTIDTLSAICLNMLIELENNYHTIETKSLCEYGKKHLTHHFGNTEEKSKYSNKKYSLANFGVLTPKIIYQDTRKGDYPNRHIKAEKLRRKFVYSLENQASYIVLDGSYLNENRVSLHNEIGVLSNYVSEVLLCDESMFPTDFFQISEIREKYRLNRLALPIGFERKSLRKVPIYYFGVGIYPPLLALPVTFSFIPRRSIGVGILVVDFVEQDVFNFYIRNTRGRGDRKLLQMLRKGLYIQKNY